VIVLIRTRENHEYYLICENYLKRKLEFSQSIINCELASIWREPGVRTIHSELPPVREVEKIANLGWGNEKVYLS
jgi:hypothetical protein